MSLQLSLFDIEKKRRVRYVVPTYIKFYTIWQYNRDKFKKLLDEWLETEEGKNRSYKSLELKQAEILEKCYIKDSSGLKLRDSDETHIYRIRTLHNLFKIIYSKIAVFLLFQEKKIDGLYIDEEEQQAEIIGTWQLPIKKRVIIHIEFLRMLKEGVNVQEALKNLERNLHDKVRQKKLS